MHPLRAVVFDLDGTLLDQVTAVTTALQAWLPELGVRYSDSLTQSWFDAEERHLPAWRMGAVTMAEQRRRRLQDFLPLVGQQPNGDERLDATFATYLRHYERAWVAFEDAPAALAATKAMGLVTAVLTNGPVEQQNAKITAVGLAGAVGQIFASEQLPAAKPDPAAYLTVCRALDLDPRHVLHVGDNYDLDVTAARAAGLRAVHLDRYHSGPHGESERLTSLSQFADYISRLSS